MHSIYRSFRIKNEMGGAGACKNSTLPSPCIVDTLTRIIASILKLPSYPTRVMSPLMHILC
jgi:hypothetical protein